MTDAAAVGLGYSPPYQSSLSSSGSSSEVEEVVLMHDSGDADDEGDCGDENWAPSAVESDSVAHTMQMSVSAVTRCTADESVSIIEVAQAVAARAQMMDNLSEEQEEGASASNDDVSRVFTTAEPQPPVYRSLDGVASVGSKDSSLMGNAEDDAEPGDEAQARELVTSAAARGDRDATNMETESLDGGKDANACVGGLTDKVPASDDEAEFGDVEPEAQSDASRDESAATASSAGSDADVKTEWQQSARPSPVDTAGGADTATADQSTPKPQEVSHGVKRKTLQPSSSITPRQSKRIKHKTLPPPPPAAMRTKKSPAKAKTATSDDSEAHFDVVEGDDDTDSTPHLQCKYCGRKLMHRKGAPARHLNNCDVYKARIAEENALAIKIENVADHSNTTSIDQTALESLGDALMEQKSSSHGHNRHNVKLDHEVEVEANQTSALLWLFGSVENANRMKTHYRRAPLTLAAPIERLNALIYDHLSGLDIPRLVETLDSDATISLVIGEKKRARRATKVKIESIERAKELHELGLSLSFPAPQRTVDLVITTLADDMGLGRFSTAEHKAKIMSCRPETVLEWQFHRSECFVFVLQGSALWKLKSGGARHPLRCFHPHSRSLKEADDVVKVHTLAEEPGGQESALVTPPFDDNRVFDDMDDGADDVKEAEVKPGALVYMPAGTWYEVETAVDAVWLEVHLLPMTYEQVVMAALRPLLWRSNKWRAPFFRGGAQDHGRTAREQVGELLEDLQEKIAALTPNDVIPEYMLLDGESDEGGALDLDVDLRRSVPFRETSKYFKINNALEFRVNPAAVLMRTDEILRDVRAASAPKPTVSQSVANPPSRTLQKKLKHKHPMQALARGDDHEYVLHGGFGNDAFESKVRVKFRCSAGQAALVEWVRDRESPSAFNVDALKAGLKAAGGELDDGAVKHVLRFLWCFGYVSQIKCSS